MGPTAALSDWVGCSAPVNRSETASAFLGAVAPSSRSPCRQNPSKAKEFGCFWHPSFAGSFHWPPKLLVIVALVSPPPTGLGKCVFDVLHPLPIHTAAYNDSTHWEAMAAVFQHLKVTQLSPKEKEAVLECGEFLNTAPFRAQDDYEVCTDNDGLGTSSQLFIDSFAPGTKVHTPTCN